MRRSSIWAIVAGGVVAAACSSSGRAAESTVSSGGRTSTNSTLPIPLSTTAHPPSTSAQVAAQRAPKDACETIFGDLEAELATGPSATFQGHRVVIADAQLTAKLLKARDGFYTQLSPLDRQILATSSTPVDTAQLDDALTLAAQEWSSIELSDVRSNIAEAERRANAAGVKFKLPDPIVLAKQSDQLYSGSPYTRCATVFSTGSLRPSVLLHEFEHIVSRYHPEFRAKLYPLVGYQPCSVRLDSLGADVRARVITNPDTEAFGDFCITLNDKSGRPTRYVPVLIGTGTYSGEAEGWEEILDPVLVEVVNNKAVVVAGVTSRTALFTQEYMEAVGLNGEFEPFHPEELIAINLAGAIVPEEGIFPNPELLDAVKAAFAAL